MLHFRLGPFPVRIESSFLIMAVLFGWGGGSVVAIASWVLIVFLSVLIHELGHAVVGLMQGGRPEIILQGLGGVTFPRLRSRTTAAQQILLSVAGPFAGLIPGAIALAVLIAQQHISMTGGVVHVWTQILRLSGARNPLDSLLGTAAEMSVLWTVLNLLPVIPLDGGHVMEIAITAARKKPSGAIANWISAVSAIVLAVVAYFLFGQMFVAIFMVFMAASSIGRARALSRGAPVQARQQLPDDAAKAYAAQGLQAARDRLNGNDLPGALQIADALEQAPDPFVQAAGVRIRAGVALMQGQYMEAGRQAGRAFSLSPIAEAAVLASRAALRSGQTEIAKTWLKRAIESGAGLEQLRSDSELGSLV